MTTVGIRRFDDSVELASITSDADDVTSDVDTPQNLTYSLHEAGGGNDWWNRFQPGVEVQSILGTPIG